MLLRYETSNLENFSGCSKLERLPLWDGFLDRRKEIDFYTSSGKVLPSVIRLLDRVVFGSFSFSIDGKCGRQWDRQIIGLRIEQADKWKGGHLPERQAEPVLETIWVSNPKSWHSAKKVQQILTLGLYIPTLVVPFLPSSSREGQISASLGIIIHPSWFFSRIIGCGRYQFLLSCLMRLFAILELISILVPDS